MNDLTDSSFTTRILCLHKSQLWHFTFGCVRGSKGSSLLTGSTSRALSARFLAISFGPSGLFFRTTVLNAHFLAARNARYSSSTSSSNPAPAIAPSSFVNLCAIASSHQSGRPRSISKSVIYNTIFFLRRVIGVLTRTTTQMSYPHQAFLTVNNVRYQHLPIHAPRHETLSSTFAAGLLARRGKVRFGNIYH